MDAKSAEKKTKVFNLTETQKAVATGLSASFLQKDRLRDEPRIEFKRYGRAIRYSMED